MTRALRLALATWITAALAAPSIAAGQAPAGCDASLPVVAHHAGGVEVTLPAGAALPTACVDPIGHPTSETSLAIAGDGSLLFSPAQTENTMARSGDGGATWSLTKPAVEQPTAFWNTVDPFVLADRRTGWVFWSHATGPVRNEGSLPHVSPLAQGLGFYLAAAQGFQVYGSSDDGRTWTTADYSTAPTGDWEKLAVGPPAPASSGAPQPSGYPDVVYLCANSPLEVSGPGRLCYRSLDGGRTFSIAGYVSPSVGEPADVCEPLNFNVPAVGPDGTLYEPASCERGNYIAISHDEGSTYTWMDTPAPAGDALQVAIDDSGNLYAMWPAGGLLYLSISRDQAKSWSSPMMISGPHLLGADLPELAAGAAGQVAVVYYANTTPSASLLTAYVTQTADALAAQPLFYTGALNDPTHPLFHDYGLSDAPRADFIGGGYDRAGTAYWAGFVKQLGPPDADENIATVGEAGTLLFSPSTPRSLP